MSLSRKIGNIGSILDSASTGTFMSKAASDAAFESISYSSLSGTPTVLDSANVTAIVDSAYVQARQTLGSSALDSAAITSIIDSNYVQARTTPVSSGFVDYEYTATSGQTTFQDSDLNSNILSYTTDGIMVFYNGVLLRDSSDYTASDGSSVVLASGADSGSTVSISKWTIPSAGGAGGAAAWYGDRALNFLGRNSSGTTINSIDYFDITTAGNASDFGDLTSTRRVASALSDKTYGLIGGGLGYLASIDYVTIATIGNASDFGDLTTGRYGCSGCSDGTTGVWGGGFTSAPAYTDVIDYVTIASPGNATDFGDLTSIKRYTQPSSNSTYGVFGGGYDYNYINGTTGAIDYVTIATPGNAADFGDLTSERQRGGNGTVSDETYGIFTGGSYSNGSYSNVIDYITIASPGNATDFGDLLVGQIHASSTGNGSRGVDMAGSSSGSYTNVIQYFTITSPGNATDFGDLTISADNGSGTSGSPS